LTLDHIIFNFLVVGRSFSQDLDLWL